MNKKSKIFLITSVSLILIFLFLSKADIPPQYNFEDYKIQEYLNIIVASEKTSFCSWKPDSTDDGYKFCNPEIIIWNRRATPINIDMVKDNFDFKITKTVRNNVDFYYSTDWEIYEEQRMNKTNSSQIILVSKISFSNWKPLDDLTKSIPPYTIVGIRLEFELSKYSGASWDFTYKPLNMLLDPDISACGTLNTANTTYTLTQGVNSTGTCFSIQAQNVTLNCQGNYINYSYNAVGPSYGVYQASYDKTTVKNCIIKEGALSIDAKSAIYFERTKNSTIFNNTIKTSGTSIHGIYLYDNVLNSNITNNIITTSGSNGAGIRLETSSSYNIINNNNITTSNTNGHGILLYVSANSNNISNNIISASGPDVGGIYLTTNSNSNIIINNTIIASGGAGVSNTGGIRLDTNSNSNIFSGMKIYTNNTKASAVYIYDTNHNFTIKDSILNSSYPGQELNISGAVTGGEWNLTNVTRADGTPITTSWTSGANGTLNMHWYLDINVTSSSSPLQNANVTAWNKNNAFQFSELTNTQGRIATKTLQEFARNRTTIIYFSNYTINITKAMYNEYFNNTVNMSINRLLNIVLSLTDIIPPSIRILAPTGIYSSQLYIPVTYSVVEINPSSCWYNLTYSDGTTYLAYRGNTPINNCANVSINVTNDYNFRIYISMNDTSDNINYSYSNFQITTPSTPPINPNLPGLGAGASITTFSAADLNFTFCGNDICDAKESFYNCPQDCGEINFDTLILGCFSKDPVEKAKCIWKQSSFIFIAGILVILSIVLSFLLTKSRKEKRTFIFKKPLFKKKYK